MYILYYTITSRDKAPVLYSKTINTVLIARNFEAFYKNTGSSDTNHNNSCYVMFILYRVIECVIYTCVFPAKPQVSRELQNFLNGYTV